jgi:hypothetical protein
VDFRDFLTQQRNILVELRAMGSAISVKNKPEASWHPLSDGGRSWMTIWRSWTCGAYFAGGTWTGQRRHRCLRAREGLI